MHKNRVIIWTALKSASYSWVPLHRPILVWLIQVVDPGQRKRN
jgi:hypothetical protein